MTTATSSRKPRSATAKKAKKGPTESLYVWEGKDRSGRVVRGDMRAPSESVVQSALRRQGIKITKIKKKRMIGSKKITEKDLALFTRQLCTMMRSGVPLLQAFDITIRGSDNPSLARLLNTIRNDLEAGSSLSEALRKHPGYFDSLYCNLVGAGEQAGILENILERLSVYKEKSLALKGKIKSALFYPTAVIVVAFVVVAVIMVFVVPAFEEVFANFGAELPAPTLMVVAMSHFVVAQGWMIVVGTVAAVWTFFYCYKRSEAMQIALDRLMLKLPILGDILRKGAVARWTRTLSTMFSAGVPLVESLDSVGGAAGNYVYKKATQSIQSEVSGGTSLTIAMQNTNVFPIMAVQMVSIGEESGELDAMLEKVAEFNEREVDEAVESMSQLIEPLMMAFLGILIGGLVVAMYLPIFKLGAVV